MKYWKTCDKNNAKEDVVQIGRGNVNFSSCMILLTS